MDEGARQTQATTDDLTTLCATEIAGRVRARDVSARAVVEQHIQRIEAVNPILNAVVVPLFEQALAAADAADAALARGEAVGPLHGVPITLKEQFQVVGTAATWGLASRAHQLATAEGPLVTRLRRAGAIILGKTNVPQLLAYNESDNPLYGRTRNPWNVERTSGGSSGGEACIIAAGGSPLGLGSELGGSIRLPAHFCGVHGLMPTAGRLSNLDSPAEVYPWGQEAIVMQPGPLARSVADLALAMEVLAAPGLSELDSRVPPVPWHPWQPRSVQGMRIAMYEDDGFFAATPAIRRAVREAAEALRARGAKVEEWTPPDSTDAMWLFAGLLLGQSAEWVPRMLGNNPRHPDLQGFLRLVALPNSIRTQAAAVMRLAGNPNLADYILSVRHYSADEYTRMIGDRAQYRLRFVESLTTRGIDAIICPPHALPALTHGGSYYLMTAGSYSFLYNLLGMPAGVVAATRVRPGEESDRPRSREVVYSAAREVERGSAGLPVGVQVAGHHWREDVVLSVMAALEDHFRGNDDYPLHPPL
jgi:fatty acid amide hydrolase